MSPIKNDDLLNVAVEAGLAASNIIMEALGEPRIPDYKGKTDLVTVTDHQSENIIKSIICSNFDDHNFLAEESGKNSKGSEYLWITDPLDGTTNFVHGLPIFAISIALKYNEKTILGVVYNPASGDLYSAEIGNGAYKNGCKINVSQAKTLKRSLLVTGFPYNHNTEWHLCFSLFHVKILFSIHSDATN